MNSAGQQRKLKAHREYRASTDGGKRSMAEGDPTAWRNTKEMIRARRDLQKV